MMKDAVLKIKLDIKRLPKSFRSATESQLNENAYLKSVFKNEIEEAYKNLCGFTGDEDRDKITITVIKEDYNIYLEFYYKAENKKVQQ